MIVPTFSLATERFTRLRLHRQIELDTSGLMELSFSFGTGAIGSFELRYVALESGQNGIYAKMVLMTSARSSLRSFPVPNLLSAIFNIHSDHVLYGDGKPQQFISVGHRGQGSHSQTLSVHSYAISSSGAHAVTLYFNDGRAYIETWDLRETCDEVLPSTPPCIFSILIARVSINALTANHPDQTDISLSINSVGTQVVLHSEEPSEYGIPCHIFNCGPPAPADHDMSKPWSMNQVTACNDIKGYYGHGALHFITAESPQEKDERYLTCDGATVSVGSSPSGTSWRANKWHSYHRKTTTLACMQTCQEMAVSAKGRVSLYQTFSGVKLGDYEPGLGDENYFEVVLEREHLMVLDHLCSDLNDLDMIGCRRLVSTRDMTVTKTLHNHQDYKVQYSISVANPAFAYPRGSIVNMIRALAPSFE
ncbi:MAG: hypothetical protein J3Q66DRAFT_405399 [Benniella sp.]|nr:MAG: hypothetical protein J3Q66DRAFT_405399 [Benniella sp.]